MSLLRLPSNSLDKEDFIKAFQNTSQSFKTLQDQQQNSTMSSFPNSSLTRRPLIKLMKMKLSVN